jgi:hypothetical protein
VLSLMRVPLEIKYPCPCPSGLGDSMTPLLLIAPLIIPNSIPLMLYRDRLHPNSPQTGLALPTRPSSQPFCSVLFCLFYIRWQPKGIR